MNIIARKSEDKETNNMGHELLSFCKSSQLYICNGRSGRDIPGKLTCKNASVVDYIIVSPNLFSEISDFYIDDFNELYSDVHCPVIIKLKRNEPIATQENIYNNSKTNTYVKWERAKEDDFILNLSNEKISLLTDKLNLSENDYSAINKDTVNNLVKDVQDILIDAATEAGIIKTKSKRNGPITSNKKVWFDNSCKLKRKIYNKLRKKELSTNKENSDIKNQRKYAAKEYKKTVRTCYRNYISTFENNLRGLKSKYPKDYWNLINKRINQKKHKIPSCNDFLDFF